LRDSSKKTKKALGKPCAETPLFRLGSKKGEGNVHQFDFCVEPEGDFIQTLKKEEEKERRTLRTIAEKNMEKTEGL